jgi:hypothetical protein
VDSLRFLIPVRQTTLHSGIGGSFQAVVMALFLRQLHLERGATRGPTNAERNLIPIRRCVACTYACRGGSGRMDQRYVQPSSEGADRELTSKIARPRSPRVVSKSQISPSETVGTVLPCAPSVAACDGRLARQPEHFVGAELDSGRTPPGEARRFPSRRPRLGQPQAYRAAN